MSKLWEDLDTYSPDAQACPCCGIVGELVYNQYLNWWSCSECGEDSEQAQTDKEILK